MGKYDLLKVSMSRRFWKYISSRYEKLQYMHQQERPFWTLASFILTKISLFRTFKRSVKTYMVCAGLAYAEICYKSGKICL